MAIRDALRKAAGLFVEIEQTPTPAASSSTPKSGLSFEELMAKSDPKNIDLSGLEPESKAATAAPATKTVEQIVKDSPGPNLDEIKILEPERAQPTAPGGEVRFSEIYRQASLPASSFTAEQALEMINSLPADLPIDAKRQTVRITMGAMGQATGVNAESVVADASRKLAALAAYSDSLTKRTSTYVAATQLEISQLENQISEKRRVIEETKLMLERADHACDVESDRLDDVLEFFSLDVGPSKLAP